MRRNLNQALVTFAALGLWSQATYAERFDIAILNARVIDGSGNPYRYVDVGIVGDKVTAVGDLSDAEAVRKIDGKSLYVAPGFIDMHSHADRGLASDNAEARKALNLITQGITTVVVGPDGRNVHWPLAKELAAYGTQKIALNVVPMVGHGAVRTYVMGDDHERAATEAEIFAMQAQVDEGMRAGAWGLGAGLEYRPGRFGDTKELVALAKVVARYDGFYISHQRSQSPLPRWQLPSQLDVEWRVTGTDGMLETIQIGREAGIRVVGTHIKAKGPQSWGHSSTDIQLINDARREGVQVYLDQYPYPTFGSSATTVIPKWVYTPPGTDWSGGDDDPALEAPSLYAEYKKNLRANLSDPKTQEKVYRDIQFKLDLQGGARRHVIVESPDDPTLVGKTLLEVANQHGRSPIEQALEFALASRSKLRSGVLFRPVAGSSFDVENYMRQEYTATSTDAAIVTSTKPGDSPRLFGSYPQKLANYARDKEVITLEFAVRSSTSLPAQIIGLQDRGLIVPGFKADLVVFDLGELADRSTIESPGQFSAGIRYVISNGEFTVDNSAPTGNRPGKVLLKPARKK